MGQVKAFLHALVAVGLFIVLMLGVGCSTVPTVVKEPVPVRCSPQLGPEPAYPDTDAAIKALDGNPFGQVQLLLEGRLERIQRDIEKSAALDGCEKGPSPLPSQAPSGATPGLAKRP